MCSRSVFLSARSFLCAIRQQVELRFRLELMNIVRVSLIAEVTVSYHTSRQCSSNYVSLSSIKIERARAFSNWPAPLRDARGSKRGDKFFLSVLLFIKERKERDIMNSRDSKWKRYYRFPHIFLTSELTQIFPIRFYRYRKTFLLKISKCCHKRNKSPFS